MFMKVDVICGVSVIRLLDWSIEGRRRRGSMFVYGCAISFILDV
jgi:hypothetical protein